MNRLLLMALGFGMVSAGTALPALRWMQAQTGKAQAGRPQGDEMSSDALPERQGRADRAQSGKTQVGSIQNGQYLLPTYQQLHPAGESLLFGGRPVDLVLSPDHRVLYVKDNRGLVVVDARTWQLRQELPFPQGGGSMHGLAVTGDGRRVYATNAQNQCCEATVAPDGKCAWTRTLLLPGPDGRGASHPCGLALAPDEKRAYVCLSRNNALGILNLETGELQAQIPVGVAPWDVTLSADGRTAYVSNWGGRKPRPDEKTAPSSGTETLVDARGVASSGTISFVDLQAGKEITQIETGLHPSDVELDADGKRLYVANANSDTVSVVECAERRLVETISVRPDPALPFGSAPTGLALGADGKTLFVTLGGNNAVAVIALPQTPTARSRVLGFIPTGWYPGAIVAGGQNLFVADVKGVGTPALPPSAKGKNTLQHQGAVSRIPLPSDSDLAGQTDRVRGDARLAAIRRAQEHATRSKTPASLPARAGEPSVFEHVVYVIKENRTYDQVFGDLKQGNGDPHLCLYGRKVTPNEHALAEQFVLLDNFYCNGVLSADGHSWATEGNVTDHLEKSFGGFTRSYTFGDDPLTYSSSGFLWDGALQRGLAFRNYGEMDYAKTVPAGASFTAIYKDYVAKTGRITFAQSIGLETMRRYSCPNYPGWNLNIPDALRADRFLAELKQAAEQAEQQAAQTHRQAEQPEALRREPQSAPQENRAKGQQNARQQTSWPNLMLVYLPQDHTSGTSPNMPTPRAMVADNDLALGRIVEGISHSRFWPRTCIFVVEDDPQDGFDHVDGHRSPCLVISPYTKRRRVVHAFYNQTSVLHTIELILGLPAMNQFDALAPPMRACFNARPDLRPYQSLANQIPLDEMNPPLNALHGRARKWAQQSLALNFRQPDDAEEDALNRILWHAARGVNAPYPARLAGAHGRGKATE